MSYTSIVGEEVRSVLSYVALALGLSQVCSQGVKCGCFHLKV